jgi:hypothetical protein
VQARLRVGDVVEVLSPEEILRTLDGDGTLEGLPFMPEMMEFCGRRFHIAKRVRKVCVECDLAGIDMREFRGEEPIWLIAGLRCTGAFHDGCQRGCTLFWKDRWLRKVDSVLLKTVPSLRGEDILLSALKVTVSPGRYFCQSTELEKVTEPITVFGRIRICVQDVLSGNESWISMLKQMLQPVFWKLMDKYIKPRHVIGSLNKTPLIQMRFRPGQLVEVKPAEEIKSTLNSNGCNRGLRYDYCLNQFCGRRFRVRERLDKIIIESRGHMIPIEGTVTLEGSHCHCERTAFGGCPRQDLVYWREAWLNPADESRDAR